MSIIGIEAKHVIHIPKSNNNPDTHMVKEVIHFEDGSVKRRVRLHTNVKIPFYVTKKMYRNHKDKKEYEYLDKLNKYTTTASDMANNIAKAIGKVGYSKNNMRDVVDSPYLYGANISPTSYVKHIYTENNSDLYTPSTVCTLDIECDVDDTTLYLITVSMSDNVYTAINTRLVKDKKHLTTLNKMYINDIPDSGTKDTIGNNVVMEIFDNELDMIREAFKRIHSWKPDFLAIHNMNYDIPIIVNKLYDYNVQPQDIFSDPSIPKNLRFFKYKQDKDKIVKEDNKERNKQPQELWHTVLCPSSFYVIDTMTTYNYVRVNTAKVPGGYGLDNLLKRHGVGGKLYSDVGGLYAKNSADWHRYMVEYEPLKYVIYNQYDTISMHELEKITNDLSTSVEILSGNSDYSVFNSGPKKIVNSLYFYYLSKNRVLGTAPSKIEKNPLLGLGKWIVMLPMYLTMDNGLNVVDDNPIAKVNTRAHAYDIDAESSYPSNGVAANISTQTTKKEILEIEDMDKSDFMNPNLELFTGEIASINYCVEMFDLPNTDELIRMISDDEK